MEATAEQRQQQRWIVAKYMTHVPDNMNINEGYNFMTLLYKIGTILLSEYFAALDAADENGYNVNGYKV
jgi:hypothetical protein